MLDEKVGKHGTWNRGRYQVAQNVEKIHANLAQLQHC